MSQRHRLFGYKALAASISPVLVAAHPLEADLNLTVDRMRSERGMLHICLTRDSQHFPDCSDDIHAIRRSVPASVKTVLIEGLVPGSYSVSILHDENRNGRMDSFLGVPKEGFGFSGNPAIRFGPPRFDQTTITLPGGAAQHTVRMRYLL